MQASFSAPSSRTAAGPVQSCNVSAAVVVRCPYSHHFECSRWADDDACVGAGEESVVQRNRAIQRKQLKPVGTEEARDFRRIPRLRYGLAFRDPLSYTWTRLGESSG